MYKEIKANKFICSGCSKVVKVNTFEDIVRLEKKCADCSLMDVTGGFKEAKPMKSKPKAKIASKNTSYNSLKREDRKKSKKKPISTKRKEEARMKWDLKRERECYGMRNID